MKASLLPFGLNYFLGVSSLFSVGANSYWGEGHEKNEEEARNFAK